MNFYLATLDDLDTLQELALYTFRVTYGHLNEPADFKAYLDIAFSKKQMSKELTNSKSWFYFLKKEATIIGYIKLNAAEAQTDLHEADSLELERIYVLPTYQGKGFGKLLMGKAIASTQEKQKASLWLGVWDQNPKAIQFYENQGFHKFGEHEFIIGADHQIDYLMRKQV